MTVQKEMGRKGETLAVSYLKRQGYQILETNWRYGRAEVDIIAMIENILVFVEVKTRSYNYYGPPEMAVNAKKERFLAECMQAYMELIDHQWEVRFDIISILWNDQAPPSINHIVNAFFPGLA